MKSKTSNQPKLRRAIAMVELVIAITVIGITLLAAPMLIERSTKSSFVALQQESIAAASTQMAMIMSRQWDENNAEPLEKYPVLQTASTIIPNCTGARPPGVTSASGRYCRGENTGSLFNASTIGDDLADDDDIDDFNGQSYTISIYETESFETYQGDYIDRNISVSSSISYGDDVPRLSSGGASAGGYDSDIAFSNPFTANPSGTTNIKRIQVTLTSTNPATELSDKEIELSAFMCNIGAPNTIIIRP